MIPSPTVATKSLEAITRAIEVFSPEAPTLFLHEGLVRVRQADGRALNLLAEAIELLPVGTRLVVSQLENRGRVFAIASYGNTPKIATRFSLGALCGGSAEFPITRPQVLDGEPQDRQIGIGFDFMRVDQWNDPDTGEQWVASGVPIADQSAQHGSRRIRVPLSYGKDGMPNFVIRTFLPE